MIRKFVTSPAGEKHANPNPAVDIFERNTDIPPEMTAIKGSRNNKKETLAKLT